MSTLNKDNMTESTISIRSQEEKNELIQDHFIENNLKTSETSDDILAKRQKNRKSSACLDVKIKLYNCMGHEF